MFRNETENVARRAGSQSGSQSETSTSGPSTAVTRPPSPEIETTAKEFFFQQFVTAGHMAFLERVTPDEFLLKPIIACALAAMSNRSGDIRGGELARKYYGDAITATNTALRDPRRVKEDNTLISVCLLSMFEVCLPNVSCGDLTDRVQRLAWELSDSPNNSWRHHIGGAAQVLQLRGQSQLRSHIGLGLFRELRDSMVRGTYRVSGSH